MDSKTVFEEILKRSDRGPLAVFDLDSTLFNVSFRTKAILDSLASEARFRAKYPTQAELLANLDVLPTEWGVREPLSRSGLAATVDFFHDVRTYWRHHFFSSNFLSVDQPYEGAVDYVAALKQSGTKILYLTGRDELNMRKGTLESLQKWRFPLEDPDLDLIMKPRKGSIEDAAFKASRLATIKPPYEHIWFFENEPVILHQVSAEHPEIKLVFIDTTHSRRADPPQGLPTIPGRYVR